jgi:phospholipid N-methyltransferase
MWTPGREDLLISLCGSIGDEDTTLVDRAEERAERFDGYSARRGADAEAARSQVEQIAGRFEFGQPILVGHHSERRARKDKERIDNGMRKAVANWEKSEYWTNRAAGAVRHAKYKELPDVRYRRIKGLESDLRKQQKYLDQNEGFMKLWAVEGLTLEQATDRAGRDRLSVLVDGSRYESLYSRLVDGHMTAEEAKQRAISCHTRSNARAARWIAHFSNRIQYERAMLGESGGIAADKFDIAVGGTVLVRGEWVTVLRINKKAGRIVSVSTNARFVPVRSVEEIDDYRAPTAETAAAVAKATTKPKLCNYPGEGFLQMTQAEWKATHADYKGSRQLGQDAQRARAGSGRPDVQAATADAATSCGLHRVRVVVRGGLQPVYLTDAKIVPAPKADATPCAPAVSVPAPVLAGTLQPAPVIRPPAAKSEFDAMRHVLRNGGAQAVVADQLFATSLELGARVVAEADIQPGDEVLEPSAGTGSLLERIADYMDSDPVQVTAVEINAKLTDALTRNWPHATVICGDFLAWNGNIPGQAARASFNRIVVNPPFANGIDITHIKHALTFLAPGGRLVAICLDGPRQQAALKPLADESCGFYEPLPADSFKHAGTGVNTALVVING